MTPYSATRKRGRVPHPTPFSDEGKDLDDVADLRAFMDYLCPPAVQRSGFGHPEHAHHLRIRRHGEKRLRPAFVLHAAVAKKTSQRDLVIQNLPADAFAERVHLDPDRAHLDRPSRRFLDE